MLISEGLMLFGTIFVLLAIAWFYRLGYEHGKRVVKWHNERCMNYTNGPIPKDLDLGPI